MLDSSPLYKMIIYKTRNFCSFFRRFMDNLEAYEFSNVIKTVSNTTKIRNTRNSSKTIKEQSNQQIKVQTVNIPIIKQKNKQKRFIQDPCKTYEKIHEWRKTHLAPVDTMGCQRLSQSHQTQQIQKYQTLISLMLSIQTTDQITSMVVRRLQQHGLTPKNIVQTPEPKLIQLIYESNFNRRKGKNIIQVSKIVLEKGLPKNQKQLLELPGIGVKIAMIYLRTAEGIQNGIGVDTHVHRISNKLGWVQTSTPNETEQQLQQLFPKKYWTDMNIDLVGFGQILCNAKKPLCSECPVKSDCPSSLFKQKNLQW